MTKIMNLSFDAWDSLYRRRERTPISCTPPLLLLLLFNFRNTYSNEANAACAYVDTALDHKFCARLGGPAEIRKDAYGRSALREKMVAEYKESLSLFLKGIIELWTFVSIN